MTIGQVTCSLKTDRIRPMNTPTSRWKNLGIQGGTFELGTSVQVILQTTHYLGICYAKIPVRTVVWVANHDNQIKDNSSMLSITKEGNLALVTQNERVVYVLSASSKTKALAPLLVQLLDSGNLILRNQKGNDPQSYLWQSFDYPCDTLLPGMKLGWDLKTGLNRRLSSWKNWDDPSAEEFTNGIVLITSYPELVMWKGEIEYCRSGPWNGNNFFGLPTQHKVNPFYDFKFLSKKDEVYYTYDLKNKSLISRWVLNQTVGARQRLTWIEKAKNWRVYTSVPIDTCDSYNLWGPYGNCIMGESPICLCLKGFKL